MKTAIPNPYFANVPKIGDLTMDYVILDYDYPLLFVCRDGSDNLYLCDCCDTYKEQRWIIAPISKRSLIALLTNKLTLRAAFEQAEGNCCVAVWSKEAPAEKYTLISAKEFDPEDLPDKGAYLDADEGEFEDYIDRLIYMPFNVLYQEGSNTDYKQVLMVNSGSEKQMQHLYQDPIARYDDEKLSGSSKYKDYPDHLSDSHAWAA